MLRRRLRYIASTPRANGNTSQRSTERRPNCGSSGQCSEITCIWWTENYRKWEDRMYPGYQPKPDDVFYAVGYTTRDISDNTHFHLHRISDRVRMENENLWRQLGPLVHAMQSGKVKREFVEVLSVDPFLGNYEMPYTGPHKEIFLSIEYLSDAAFRLCREYGIRHPAVIEKVKRADIPGNHGITLRTVHYSRI